MRKELLIVTETMGIDGPERVISELTNQWYKIGYDITVVLTRSGSRNATYPLHNEIRVIKVHAHDEGGKMSRINEIRQVREILLRNPNAVCISLMISTSFSLAMASIGLKNKIILSERNDPAKVPFTSVQRTLRNLSFEFADNIVFQTKEAMNYFPKRIRKKGVIIFNPVNPDLPERYTGTRKKIFVAAGRLASQKNFSLLIEAFTLFSKDYPDYQLIIFGEGPDREKLQHLIDQSNMGDRISMPGFFPNVYEEMWDCTAYVSSSDYEGMSNSMLEALAMGVPTICTDCPIGGARQVIENNKNGILVPVGDAKELALAMRKILEDTGLSNSISVESQKLRTMLSIEKISNMWETIISGRIE